MPRRQIAQVILAIFAIPPTYFWIFYCYRWILTGKWIEGGGERAMVGFFISLCLIASIVISEFES